MCETTAKHQTKERGKGLRLLTEGGEMVEKLSINQILDEIELVFMNPVRSAHHIPDYGDASKKQCGLAESLLHTTIMHWDKFQRDLADCFLKPLKPEQKSTFDNDRLWEYVAQLNIDGQDPADILESWLKVHNPDYFEDS